MMTLFEGFEACPDRVAFMLGDDALTYGELDRRSRRYAAGLAARGVSPGDRVAVQSGSSRDLLIALLGHLRSGVIHVPINTRYRAEEIAHILSDSGAALVLYDEGAAAGEVATTMGCPSVSLASLPSSEVAMPDATGDDATAMLIYTSGTTGRSKGVALSLSALTANIGATTGLWRWSPSDHLILTLPLFHVHGLGLGVLGTLLNQMTATIFPKFDAGEVVDAMARGGTIFMGVPTMYARLLAFLEDHASSQTSLSEMRLFTSGSAALPASSHAAFEALTGHRILERYGMSETGFTLSNPYDRERRAGTVGQAVPGYTVRIVDEAGETCPVNEPGEIWVRGDGMMRGYWGQPEVTEAAFTDGWFRTGDVALLDPEGYHRILGRRSADIIKSGGFKISALEIEDVLLRHPAVREAAVLGLPDPEWGERIEAVVVVDPAHPFQPQALRDLARDQLAAYKCPRDVHVMAELPRNALGKLQKHRLKERLLVDE
ncbi:MAG: class I adenylate-forming enzyme family protein [Myxococcota bacterium]